MSSLNAAVANPKASVNGLSALRDVLVILLMEIFRFLLLKSKYFLYLWFLPYCAFGKQDQYGGSLPRATAALLSQRGFGGGHGGGEVHHQLQPPEQGSSQGETDWPRKSTPGLGFATFQPFNTAILSKPGAPMWIPGWSSPSRWDTVPKAGDNSSWAGLATSTQCPLFTRIQCGQRPPVPKSCWHRSLFKYLTF